MAAVARRLAALIALALTLSSLPARAAAPLSLGPAELSGAVPEVEVLEDPSGRLRFEDVRATPERFAARSGLNVGYTSTTFWTHFSVENRGSQRRIVLVEQFRAIDHLDFHEVRQGRVRLVETGHRHPFGSREVGHANFVFRTAVEPGERVDYFTRLASSDSFDLTPKIWSESAFLDRVRTETFETGLYYGVMLALILYNAFVLLATRARSYGPYVGFQLCYTALLAAFDRYTFQYLWPNHPEWSAKSELVFGSAALVFGAWFARSFLELPRHMPRMNRVIGALMTAAVVLLPLGAITAHTWAQQATLYLAMTLLATSLATGFIGWARGVPNARYLAIAYVLLVVATVFDTLVTAGLVTRPQSPTLYLRIGSAGEALLLAFALANRINVAQLEKERATSALAESRKQYAETLEARVVERTRELQDAQTELARKERLASLGRLVAGVAHEINNPLTFGSGGATKLRSELGVLGRFLASLRGTPVPAKQADGLEQAEQAHATAQSALELVDAGNQRIGTIVSNLQSFVRSERTEPIPTDISGELETILGLCADELEKAEVMPVLQIQSLPPCVIRPGELGQVFVNLVINACHAMKDRGGTLTISTGADPESVWVRFADTGPGIPEELRERIFEPFFTTREPGEGTGLGLSVSHEIVARHGGELRLIPSDTGAVFEVRLPRAGQSL